MDTCKHGNFGDCTLCSGEDTEHDKAITEKVKLDNSAASHKDFERLVWLTRGDHMVNGLLNVKYDLDQYIMRVAKEAGREEPTDDDCLWGLRGLVDAEIINEQKERTK